ncbi:prepilin-type N-terminal cleavage/methylation domain-containing protein [Pseudomonas sp. SWRI50]|nr:prepilin-type N-terminal cleavage/methylation domain-containing protein [Pseudomonas sp. SWRI50]
MTLRRSRGFTLLELLLVMLLAGIALGMAWQGWRVGGIGNGWPIEKPACSCKWCSMPGSKRCSKGKHWGYASIPMATN